jgi:hypothetical protein
MSEPKRQQSSAFLFGGLIGALVGVGFGLLLGVGGLLLISSANAPQIVQPAPPTSGAPLIVIHADETYFNQEVYNAMEGDPLYENLFVDLQPPNLALASISMDVLGLPVNPTMTFQYSMVGEEVDVAILGLDVMGLNMPLDLIQEPVDALEAEIQRQVNEIADAMLEDTGLILLSVGATDDSLVIELTQE